MSRSNWRSGVFLALMVFLVGLPNALGQTKAPPSVARFRVVVPQTDAQLYFANHLTQQLGLVRTFESQELTPGMKYSCVIKVMWEPNNYTKITRRKKIDIEAGQSYVVDLRKADPKLPDDIKVRYVPTPDEVVREMLKLGKVGKGDVVFDLGCGDGRIVIDAVRLKGAKSGVGIDIDPERIQESRANASKFGVAGKVEFRQGDVLKKVGDLSKASVVMLYMGDDINLRLRPVLKAKLKPGSRVVSHRFLMGDWKPDRSITVHDRRGTAYELHLWIMRKKK